MIAIERFQAEKHYETVSAWWAAAKWPAVPLSHLPQTGVVVTLEGKPAAATWIYKTDSALCWVEWIVADPKVRRMKRDAVLSVLISAARELAREMGFRSIFMSIKHESLARRIEAQGFMATESGMTNYVCQLTEGN
jgi:hypothetical protein